MNKKSILGLLPIVATTTLPIISVSCTNEQERALDETKKEAEVKELENAKKEYTKSLTDANELKNSLGENPLYSDIKSKLVTAITSAESKTKTNPTKDLYNQAKGELDLAIKTSKDEKMKVDAAEQMKQKEAEELNAAKTKYEETLMNAESFNESLKSDNNAYNIISQKLTTAIETAKSTITDKPTKELYIKAESKLNQDLEAAKAEKTAEDEEIKSQKEAEAREFEKAKKDFEESLSKANELKAGLETNPSYSDIKSKLLIAITNAESKTKTNATKDLYNQAKGELDLAIKTAKDEKMKVDAAEQMKQKEAEELNAAKTKYEETLMNAESFNESLKSDGNEYTTISQKLTTAIETAKSTITDKPTKELYIKAESKLNQDLEAAKAEKTAKDEEIKSQKEAEAREFEKAKKDFEESLSKANELKARLETNPSYSDIKSKLVTAITSAESKTKTNSTKDSYLSAKAILDDAIKEANAKERDAFSKSLNKLTPVKFQRDGNYLTLTLSTSKDNYEKIKWERLKMLIDNGNGRVYEEYAAPFDNWDQSDKSKKLIYHIRKVDKGGTVTFDISSDHQYNNNEKGNYKVTSVLISGDTKNNLLERESEIVKIQ
ncbi:hypothetical protein JS510_02635 [Mycoplasma tauri]|uniref:Vmc-like lipoprotein signal peptide domain-containing protein n=1 Tax=Mycoplasma tauri TaxID=547987 RepID=UPI0019679DAB|nr:hypothetical protein [Mycoplasma tauri]QSB07384.1 hypothetical protein JS510_02635 [Mycoplasma tauri]